MKPFAFLTAIPKLHTLMAAVISATLLVGGWHVKTSLDYVSGMADEMEAGLRYPSSVYVWTSHGAVRNTLSWAPTQPAAANNLNSKQTPPPAISAPAQRIE